MGGPFVAEGNLMMRLLAQRVPLTLLLDLAVPPDSEELLFMESAGIDWESAQLASARD